MSGRRFHCTTEAIPRRPWKAKSPFASKPCQVNIKKGTRGVRTRYNTVRLPLISLLRCPGCLVMPVPEVRHAVCLCVSGGFPFLSMAWNFYMWPLSAWPDTNAKKHSAHLERVVVQPINVPPVHQLHMQLALSWTHHLLQEIEQETNDRKC